MLRYLVSFLTSALVNAAILIVLSIITIGVAGGPEELAFDSLLDDSVDEKPEKLFQVLEKQDTVATKATTTSGGHVSTSLQQSSRTSQLAAERVTVKQTSTMEVNAPTPDAVGIGRDQLTVDLGEDGFQGEPTAIVKGYGDALNRITQEIIRLMRKDKLLVVWLFDESESMKDDQQKIAENFHIVYRELGIFQGDDPETLKQLGKKPKSAKPDDSETAPKTSSKKPTRKRTPPKTRRKTSRPRKTRREIARENAKSPLLTAIYGYGQGLNKLLDPTADITRIVNTISGEINIDESGEEKMCAAIYQVIRRHRTMAAKQKRKLVLIVVTDESGDDGNLVEETLKLAKQNKTPLYFLGREAIFGYPYTRQRWYDPEYNLPHWIRMNRGPETAFPECLQWDGLHRRWDSFSSGFGPYEQVRLARETNGVFFVLPNLEVTLAGRGARGKRRFDEHDMREYHPLWLSRTEYDRERSRSEFRKAIWKVIIALNPTEHALKLIPRHNKDLNIRVHHYPTDLNEFKQRATREAVKAYKAWIILAQAIQELEKVQHLRADEESPRWRAAYDLARAQCLAYRVRMFQFLLRMDEHVNASPPRKVPTPTGNAKPANEWRFHRSKDMIDPSDAQFERVKGFFKLKISKEEFLAALEKDKQQATSLYQFVIIEHPGTPWSYRARDELKRGFGMIIRPHYWSPHYGSPKIKKPKF